MYLYTCSSLCMELHVKMFVWDMSPCWKSHSNRCVVSTIQWFVIPVAGLMLKYHHKNL